MASKVVKLPICVVDVSNYNKWATSTNWEDKNFPLPFSQYLRTITSKAALRVKEEYRPNSIEYTAAMEGISYCENREPPTLRKLYRMHKKTAPKTWKSDADIKAHMKFHFIEWVCDCVSAYLEAYNYEPIFEPSLTAVQHMCEILKEVNAY